jgi:hypothetical protein
MQCPFLAPTGHAAVVAVCPLSGPQQTSFARSEYFTFWTQRRHQEAEAAPLAFLEWLSLIISDLRTGKWLVQVASLEMQTRCPKCTTIVRSNGTDWEILNGACPELSGTQLKDNPEFCPTLSKVVEPEVVLPGVASRTTVQSEIERIRVVKVR